MRHLAIVSSVLVICTLLYLVSQTTAKESKLELSKEDEWLFKQGLGPFVPNRPRHTKSRRFRQRDRVEDCDPDDSCLLGRHCVQV